MLIALTAIVVGLILLVISADRFVLGASGIAQSFNVSPLIIGLTIVAFGTSAPEIFVAAVAALENNPNLAIGNALGSNIANVGLVLGSTALIAPIAVHSDIKQRQIPIMFIVMIICLVFFSNDYLSTIESIVLILLLFCFIYLTFLQGRKHTTSASSNEQTLYSISRKMSFFWLIAGLILLVVSSKLLVWGAVEIAQRLGVSDLIIGLTIVAIGTSLPEVATSLTSALKGKADLAVGNVIGSNIFNILAVIGTAGVISPTNIHVDVLRRDVPAMFIITIAMVIFMKPWKDKPSLSRFAGAILLLMFISYLLYLALLANSV